MRKIIGLILVFCLVFAVATEAFAAKPAIKKQPETATTSKKGTVSFAIQTTGSVGSITWYFCDPSTGSKYTGKQLSKYDKKIKVSNPNSKKITLKNVPESMHGWTVYCHVNGGGYNFDSEAVQLLVYGLEAPAEGPMQISEAAESAGNGKDASGSAANTADDSGEDDYVPVDKTVTVSCNAKVLRRLNASGEPEEGDPVSRITFENGSGSFIVTSEEPIKSWSANGIRFEPAEPINEFTVRDVTASLTLNVKVNKPDTAPASAGVDTSNMCHVSCEGCTFTCLYSGIRGATSGEVPAGVLISIKADSADLAAAGYKVNGAEPINQGTIAFTLTVTEDITISTK